MKQLHIKSFGDQLDFEGCLSYPGFYGKVHRSNYIKIIYQDRNGNRQELARSGFMARCFQHEIDHLDGILFIDRMQTEPLVNIATGEEVPLEIEPIF
jgi:peptide deformylase